MSAAEISPEALFEPTIDRFTAVRDVTMQSLENERWRTVDGVYVAGTIRDEDLEGITINPVQNAMPGLGDVRLISIRETKIAEALPIQKTRLYTIELDGFSHAIEITDPAEGQPTLGVLSFPGFTETIENPFRQRLHDQLVIAFPQARAISIGSNGVGSTGDRYGWNERSLHSINAMGKQRLDLGSVLLPQKIPVLVEGTSMGSVITERMSHRNFYDLAPADQLNITGLLLLAPALVDPKNIFRDMALRFVPQLTADAFMELALKTPPSEILHIVRAGRQYGLSRGDLRAMVHQVFELFQGTPEESVGEVLQNVHAIVVAGEKDILAQWKMMQRLQEEQPTQLTLISVRNRGHAALPLKAHKAIPKFQEMGGLLLARAHNEFVLPAG